MPGPALINKVELEHCAPLEICGEPLTDASKTCNDSNQCAGECIAQTSEYRRNSNRLLPDPGLRFYYWGDVVGQCKSHSSALLGCYATMKNGKPTAEKCVL
jgi:hypothetical protein